MRDNGGNLVPLEWSGLALEYFGELPMIWGGVEISRSNGLAPVYLGGLHPIYSPGWMDALLDLNFGFALGLGLADVCRVGGEGHQEWGGL